MTIRSALAMAFVAFALMAPVRADDRKSIALTGNWQGSYTCAQGHTGLTLIIDRQDDQTFSGFFHFYARRDNIMVPEGCFTISGRIVSAKWSRWRAPPGSNDRSAI